MAAQKPRTALPESMTSGPVSVTSALASGVGRERLRGPDLSAPFHGTRAPRMPADVMAAAEVYATRMPHWAVFTGRTAAHLMGAPLPPRMREPLPLDVAVPRGERAIRRRGVRGTSVTLRGAPRRIGALRIAAPEDVWCSLGSGLSVRELVALGDHLIRRDAAWTDRLALRTASEVAWRGRARLMRAADLLDERAESGPESEVRVILVAAGISGLVPNLEIRALGHRYRIDLALPRSRVAIEYQGDYHRDRDQWRRDRTRRAALEAEGWIVIELTADHLRRPDEIVALVRAAIARRAS